jgi:hypothetical protein
VTSRAKYVGIAVLGCVALLVGGASRYIGSAERSEGGEGISLDARGGATANTAPPSVAPGLSSGAPGLPSLPSGVSESSSPALPRLPGQTASERLRSFMEQHDRGHYEELGLSEDERAALHAMRDQERQRRAEMRERVLRGDVSLDDYLHDLEQRIGWEEEQEGEILGRERYEDLEWLREREGSERWKELRQALEELGEQDRQRLEELRERQAQWDERRRERSP